MQQMTNNLIAFYYSLVVTCAICSHPLAQAGEQSKIVSEPQVVHRLPGALNNVCLLNSNSPEVVKEAGILLSTFPPENKKVPAAHLNFPLQGRFDLFAHHINNQIGTGKAKTLYICALVNNPGKNSVRVKILQAASYLSLPDAPFIKLSNMVENSQANIYTGPGDRVMTEFSLEKHKLVGRDLFYTLRNKNIV